MDNIENDLFQKMKVFEMVDELEYVLGGADVDDNTPVPSGTIKFTGASVSLKDEIFVNYKVKVGSGVTLDSHATNTNKVTNVGLLLWDKQPQNVNTSSHDAALYNSAETVIVGALKDGDATGAYVIQTPGIPAKKLGDTIYACAYFVVNGQYTYSTVRTYSPQQYCYNMLNKGATGDMQSLLVSILDYGTEAQKYFNYNVDIWLPLINAGVKPAWREGMEDYETIKPANDMRKDSLTIEGYTNDTQAQIAPTVSFDGALTLNCYLKPGKKTTEDVTVYYWINNGTTANVTALKNYSGKVTVVNNGQDTFKVSIEDIPAKDIYDQVTIVAVYGNYNTSSFGYGIGTYCARMANDAKIGALARATAVYGYYAKEVMESTQAN